MTDNAYKEKQILDYEINVLTCLDFNITFPTSLRFLERYSKLVQCSPQVFYIARYLIELTLIEVCTNKWNPAILAAAGLYIGHKI